MYKTEHEFSKSLSDRLVKAKLMVTRIESHGTGNGIPDMFVCGMGLDTWLELKNDPKLSIKDKTIKVAWRPGQIAWMYTYFQKHMTKCCLTLVAASDGMFIIPMATPFKDHIVLNPQSISYEDFKWVNIPRVLTAMITYWIEGSDENYLDMINSFVNRFYPDVDYDPECLFNPDMLDKPADYVLFNNSKLDMVMTLEATIRNNNYNLN